MKNLRAERLSRVAYLIISAEIQHRNSAMNHPAHLRESLRQFAIDQRDSVSAAFQLIRQVDRKDFSASRRKCIQEHEHIGLPFRPGPESLIPAADGVELFVRTGAAGGSPEIPEIFLLLLLIPFLHSIVLKHVPG